MIFHNDTSAPEVWGHHILVTGGGGYLGSMLVPELLALGHEVSVIDTFIFGEEPLKTVAEHPRLHIHKEDILNIERISSLLNNVNVVVHLAGISNDPTSDLDPDLTISTNYLATTALARWARAQGVRQFIFSSSCSVYGASSDTVLDEQSQTGPITLYALTKLISERELLDLSTNDFRVTVLRFSTLFGLSRRMRFDLAVNVMTRGACTKGQLTVNGAGQQYRPFIHVLDAVDAIITAINAEPSVVRGQIFNVGGDHLNFTIENLAAEVAKTFPAVDIRRAPENADVRSYNVRFRKINEALNYTTKRSISDGVTEIAQAIKSGVLADVDSPIYYNLAFLKNIYGSNKESHWSVASSPKGESTVRKSND